MTEENFICPQCKSMVTQKDINHDLNNGGQGMCDCEFMVTGEDGDVWFPRIYHPYITIKAYKDKLLRDMKRAEKDLMEANIL